MKLLTRYVIREHIGPLVFALSALTSLLMLQYVARQLANLAGKGLPWGTIGHFFVLSLPFTVAMTLPMAVLVATLYAFGRMAAEHEITAFKASGVRVRALMLPVLFCALLLSLFMVWFNDQVLPAANHRLSMLQRDIARTRPTLALREQALNAITDQFFMRVARTNAETNRMYDVVIYDLSGGQERKTIYADSGVFAPAGNNRDLELTLYDGFAQEFVRGDPRSLQRSFFKSQVIRKAGVAQGFEASNSDGYKGDREMTVCELHRKYIADAIEVERVRQEYVSNTRQLRKMGGPSIRDPKQRPRSEVLGTFYCQRLVPALTGLFLPKKAKAQPPAKPDSQTPVRPDSQPVVKSGLQPAVIDSPSVGQPVQPAVVPAGTPAPIQPAPGLTAQQDSALRASGIDPNALPAAPVAAPMDSLQVYQGAVNATGVQLIAQREGLDSLAVEIHKKFALSFACFVFVLFGPPIALRFPRGGVGVTIGVSIVVFGLYYVCLMGGEALADKGRLPAYVAMWIANVIFTLVALVMLWRVESTTDTSRGGGFRDWMADRKARKKAKAQMRRPVAAGATA
ncbi:MAG TPA: LptF/LptG family permease [Gemmatimonas sp.]|uniref:LptF/LptG family permease n=1 Tax=Gemmatimonas sp. TaxID=1962908 RepID=UPI002EDADE7E